MKILGHPKTWQFLENLAQNGRFSHAYLFCGEEHLGKKTIAIEFLKLILGTDILQHPDFIFVTPVENEIKISQIRDLNWRLSLKPISSSFKAAIIDKAHLMNPEAQNCFLKTLEEPKGRTVLILITEYPEFLFKTIRSRVQKIKFYPVEKKEIDDYLKSKGLSEEESKIISEVSMGRPGVAIDFLLNPQKLVIFKQKVKELTQILNSDLSLRFQYAKRLSQEENLKEILNIWLNYFRNILLSRLNLQKSWVILKKEYTLERIKNILQLIQSINRLILTTNINSKLALEMIMLEL